MKVTKIIAGVLHHQVRCSWCKEMIWIQKSSNPLGYVCYTCSEPKFQGQQLGLTPAYKPLSSEKEYNG